MYEEKFTFRKEEHFHKELVLIPPTKWCRWTEKVSPSWYGSLSSPWVICTPTILVRRITTAVNLINHLPSTKLHNQTPYFRLFKTQPTYTHLHTFKCVCFVQLRASERTKLFAQSTKCAFLDYASHKKRLSMLWSSRQSCSSFSKYYLFLKLIFFSAPLWLFASCSFW